MAVSEEKLVEIQKIVEKMRDEVEAISEEKNSAKNNSQKLENLQEAIDKYEEDMNQVKGIKEKNEKLKEQVDGFEEMKEKVIKLEEFKKNATDFAGFQTGDKKEEKDEEMEKKHNAFINYASKGLTNMEPDSKKDLTSLSDSSGGYTVPADYREQLLSPLPDESVMRQLCTVVNTGRDKVQVPELDGSFSWTWGDGTSLPTANSESPYNLITINVKNADGLIQMTQGLLEDSVFNIADHIAEEFGRSLALEEDDVVIGGNGNDEPEGILKNATVLSSHVTTTGTSGSVDVDDFIDLLYAVEQKYARGGSLLVRRGIVKTLRKLKDGEGRYLWEPSLQQGEPPTFDGVSLYQPSSSSLDNSVSAGNNIAIFGNFDYYWIVDRIDMTMQRFDEKYAPLIGLYFRMRRGGKVVLPEAFEVLQVN
jgi:HK97 family phage major capsid protein